MDKYSVIVSARTRDEMRALGRFGYDLFPNTAKDTKDEGNGPNRRKITRRNIRQVAVSLSVLKRRASKPLRRAISEAQRDLKSGIKGKTLRGLFKHLNKRKEA